MIISGQRYTPIILVGKKYNSLVLALLVVIFVISGCAAGRGDWEYDLLGEYSIDRLNAHGIALIINEGPEESGSYVIPNYYVTDFCVNERFIGVKGVRTASTWATDEELRNKDRVFYLVDAICNEVYGPYVDMDGFMEQCEMVDTGDMGCWCSTDDIG